METITTGPLPYLLSHPEKAASEGAPPLLVFLHGYDEAAPRPLKAALSRHGPLHPANAALVAPFMIIAPQLPLAGDLWHRYARELGEIIDGVQARHGADPLRSFLTGFSFGGNGVFDLALGAPDRWAALWAVDPTRLPHADPGLPIWLSVGAVARTQRERWVRTLGLHPPDEDSESPRVWLDQEADHVGSARLAYGDARIYRWLLHHSRGR